MVELRLPEGAGLPDESIVATFLLLQKNLENELFTLKPTLTHRGIPRVGTTLVWRLRAVTWRPSGLAWRPRPARPTFWRVTGCQYSSGCFVAKVLRFSDRNVERNYKTLPCSPPGTRAALLAPGC